MCHPVAVIHSGARWLATLGSVLGAVAGCSSEASSPYGTTSSGGAGAGSSTSTATSSGGGGGAASWLGEVVPDFGLMDVNPTSPSYDTAVSPRDYLEQISGWFFGAAT